MWHPLGCHFKSSLTWKVFRIIFLRGCWEDLTKKTRIYFIYFIIGDVLYALASLARGGSRALKSHITKDTWKIFKSLKSTKYPIILLFYWKTKLFRIIFLRGCWEDLKKKHAFIGRRETSRVSTIHLYDTLYALAIGKPRFPLWTLPLYALALLARGGSRALKRHITKDTWKIFKRLKSPKYSIILLFLLKNKSIQNYFFERLLRRFVKKTRIILFFIIEDVLYCARYRETKVQALMCAQSAHITRICAQSVSFADTISACPLWTLPLYCARFARARR